MPSLETRWRALAGAGATPAFQRVDSDHPLDLYIGGDGSGSLMLLLITAERPPAPRDYQHLKVLCNARADGRWALVLQLTNPSLSPVFIRLGEDIVEFGRGLADPRRPVRPVLARLTQWLSLLAKGGQGRLTRSEMRGLFAELLAMEIVVRPVLGLEDSYRAWRGPGGSKQDFQTPSFAWEVKACQPGAQAVLISSEHQLDCTTPAELVVVDLAETEAGGAGSRTLNALVAERTLEVEGIPELADLLQRRLDEVGYQLLPEYDVVHFRATDVRRYAVGPGFPSITPAGLVPGVTSVNYSLLLTALEPFLVRQ